MVGTYKGDDLFMAMRAPVREWAWEKSGMITSRPVQHITYPFTDAQKSIIEIVIYITRHGMQISLVRNMASP